MCEICGGYPGLQEDLEEDINVSNTYRQMVAGKRRILYPRSWQQHAGKVQIAREVCRFGIEPAHKVDRVRSFQIGSLERAI